MSEIGITDHADFEPLDPCHGTFRPEPHWQAVQQARARFAGRLTVRAGVECGETHLYRENVTALLSAHPYDFVLGSLHWVDRRPTFNEAFFDGLTLDEGLALYFDELARLAAVGEYDVLAHLDIIRRAAYRRFGLLALDLAPHESRLRRALHIAAARGKGIEVNTSYSRKGMGEPGPPLQVLRWFREEGGRIVTLGSDAHRPQAVGADFDRALAAVRKAGFEQLTVFNQRSPTQIRLTDTDTQREEK